MKVCIVTVYNSINSGSYWQARALGIVLEKLGINVVYLDRENSTTSSSSFVFQLKLIVKKFIKYGLTESKRYYRMFKEFRTHKKDFKVIPNNKKYFKDIDMFILGSDTIWNLDSDFFSERYMTYFGGEFENKNVISYAASVGNTSIETFNKYNDIPIMLNKLKFISVRDQETYNIVKRLCLNDIELVCDPTLLLTKDDYRNIETAPRENKYIFLYLFNTLSDEQIEDIKEFAKKNNLQIISGVNNYKYCDKCIVNAPNTFLNYMIYADYIVTDTFHGTIFSINLEKNFVVINREKKKVNDFLYRFDLNDRLITFESISDKFTKKIDYNNTSRKIDNFRKKSLNFLKISLNRNI